jgi:universal stress protein A
VARGPEVAQFRHILHPTDFSETADQSLMAALDLAALDAAIDIIHAIKVPFVGDPLLVVESTMRADLEKASRERGQELLRRFETPGVRLGFDCWPASPRDAIMQRLEGGNYELIAVGSHGRKGLSRVVLGSVSETVLRVAPCSVLIGR